MIASLSGTVQKIEPNSLVIHMGVTVIWGVGVVGGVTEIIAGGGRVPSSVGVAVGSPVDVGVGVASSRPGARDNKAMPDK